MILPLGAFCFCVRLGIFCFCLPLGTCYLFLAACHILFILSSLSQFVLWALVTFLFVGPCHNLYYGRLSHFCLWALVTFLSEAACHNLYFGRLSHFCLSGRLSHMIGQKTLYSYKLLYNKGLTFNMTLCYVLDFVKFLFIVNSRNIQKSFLQPLNIFQ